MLENQPCFMTTFQVCAFVSNLVSKLIFLGQVRLVDLLRYLDKYPVQVPVKGSFVFLHCTTIIVTTNVHPDQWYDYTKRQSSEVALSERFTEFLWFKSKDSPPVKWKWSPIDPDEDQTYYDSIKYDIVQEQPLQRQDATVTSTNVDEEEHATEESSEEESPTTFCETCKLEVTPALWCTCEKCTCTACLNK